MLNRQIPRTPNRGFATIPTTQSCSVHSVTLDTQSDRELWCQSITMKGHRSIVQVRWLGYDATITKLTSQTVNDEESMVDSTVVSEDGDRQIATVCMSLRQYDRECVPHCITQGVGVVPPEVCVVSMESL